MVVDDGKPVGVLTRADLLAFLARLTAADPGDPRRSGSVDRWSPSSRAAAAPYDRAYRAAGGEP